MTCWIPWCGGRVWMSRDHLADESCRQSATLVPGSLRMSDASDGRPVNPARTLLTHSELTFLRGAPQTKTVFCRLMLGGGEKRTWRDVWIAAFCTMGKYNIFGLLCFVRAIYLLKELLLNHLIKYVFTGQSYITRSCIQFNSQSVSSIYIAIIGHGLQRNVSKRAKSICAASHVCDKLLWCCSGAEEEIFPDFTHSFPPVTSVTLMAQRQHRGPSCLSQ